MNKIFYIVFISICLSCIQHTEKEKYQRTRANVLNIQDKIREILIEDVTIGNISRLAVLNDYLLISDPLSYDKLLNFFDKNNFEYIASAIEKGQGPNEIANMGYMETDNGTHSFFITDHGKQCIFSYHSDSVLVNASYTPTVKVKINEKQFPSYYKYMNDTLSFGLMIEPIGASDFKPSVGKWNMKTNEVTLMKYEHPDIERKRIVFDISEEHGIYLEGHTYYDLLTICDLDGELVYNIYGDNWNINKSNRNNKTEFYKELSFCKDKIVALYSGENSFSETAGIIRSNYPTKFLVFDLQGEYIKTLETGYQITDFCYDEENNRLIMCLDDEIQFAYLDLNDVI